MHKNLGVEADAHALNCKAGHSPGPPPPGRLGVILSCLGRQAKCRLDTAATDALMSKTARRALLREKAF